ncbi:MAG: PhzF family phenazine biosynthesis protein [Proteobacteria bacterium]|nr:PhzF family phenazine biosynthesis protein [Pseudomonadota bacterium]
MNIQKIAAFAYNNSGGNPAGVVLCDELPAAEAMLKVASEIGYSETAFLQQVPDGWRVRYFAPEREVPFCGHATIASGAALGKHSGEGEYRLILNEAEISIGVEHSGDDIFSVTLLSPETWSEPAEQDLVDQTLNAFQLAITDLNPKFPIRVAFAGAQHLILVLNDRGTLANMNYEFDRMKSIMLEQDWITISLLYQESDKLFHSRNAFAYGGVIEDPATGAAAAALAGYLRDIQWGGGNSFEILQGFDMGVPSRLLVEFSDTKGEGVSVRGATRNIEE